MRIKCPIRRLFKQLPISVGYTVHLERDKIRDIGSNVQTYDDSLEAEFEINEGKDITREPVPDVA